MPIERFSASVAGRHMACHASANLELAIPGWQPPVVDHAAGAKGHGTKVHKILEDAGALPAREILALARVLQYVGELRSTRRFKVLLEPQVTATWLKAQPGTTADLVLYTQDEIHVVDYKWGKIPVSVYDNKQLLYYDVCFAPLAPKAKGVTNHILQPMADNFESEFVPSPVLKQFMADAIATEEAIAKGSTKFGPSDECKFCPANPHSRGDKGHPMCPVMMQLLYPTPFDEDEILSL